MLLSRRRIEIERVEYLERGLTPEEAKKNRIFWLRVYDLFGSVVTAIVLICMVFTFGFRPTSVVGHSMEDTLSDGDWLITAVKKDYNYGDIVVITQPNVFNEPIIKRIIAKGGQTVDIDFTRGLVYVDGEVIKEPYIKEPTVKPEGVTFPVKVPEGKVFVMGDNRNHSTDSRSPDIGMIDTRYILGKAQVRVFPFGNSRIYE
ncbi:MAG: signal peptidase I [Ruminococcus sp.]|nr:signal peptidase I [Candidatus Copronaster equi]